MWAFALLRGLKDRTSVADGGHIENRCGPSEEHLRQTDTCGPPGGFLVASGLERDTGPEPVEQRQVIGHPAKECLNEVRMRLYEARREPQSGDVAEVAPSTRVPGLRMPSTAINDVNVGVEA